MIDRAILSCRYSPRIPLVLFRKTLTICLRQAGRKVFVKYSSVWRS